MPSASSRSSEPRPRPWPSDFRRMARRGGFHSTIGFAVDPLSSGEGRCTVLGRVTERHLNINGVVHGGVYATALDTAMGGAVVSLLAPGETTATTSLYVEFLRAARYGETLRAEGTVLRRGRHLAFVEGNLYDRQGRRLSQGHGTWYIWSAGELAHRSAGADRAGARASPARRGDADRAQVGRAAASPDRAGASPRGARGGESESSAPLAEKARP